MRGSLAVWWGDTAGSAKISLHFNIWRDLDHPCDVLDVGIVCGPLPLPGPLYLHIPGIVERDQIQDLSNLLADEQTAKAILNERVSIGAKASGRLPITILRDGKILNVVDVEVANGDIVLDVLQCGVVPEGTVVTFNNTLFAKFSADSDNYIRLRIDLSGKLTDLFVSKLDPVDKTFLSSFYRTEIVEFRINEQRNFGEMLISSYPDMRMPEIEEMHYFLVRKVGIEMVSSHARFHKMRRLEPGLWDKYLSEIGRNRPEDMIIYHWRKKKSIDGDIESYVGLATFREAKENIKFYLLVIVLLGACGSGVQAFSVSVAAEGFGLSNGWHTQLGVLIVLALLLLGIVVLHGRTRIWQWIRERVGKLRLGCLAKHPNR